MRKKLLEFLKSLLLLLLIPVILTLTLMAMPERILTQTPWLASVLRPFAGLFELDEAELTYTEPASAATLVTGAAQPVAIVLRMPEGQSSLQYSFSKLDTAYEQLGSLLAKALDTADAETAEECEVQALYDAIAGGSSVCFRFPCELPPQLLGAWLKVRAPEQDGAQWYVLLQKQEQTELYLLGKQCIRYRTELRRQALSDALQLSVPDGSSLALEHTQGASAALDAMSVISPDAPEVFTAAAENPCDVRFVSALASKLGFNPYADTRYTDAGGTTFFTETDSILSVSAQGLLTLRVNQPQERFESALAELPEQVETVRELLSELTAECIGEARLYLSSCFVRDGRTVCRFSYYLDGIEIASGGTAAEAVFEGKNLIQLQLLLRSYRETTDSPRLLPPEQAAAGLTARSELRLLYVDDGTDTLRVNWMYK